MVFEIMTVIILAFSVFGLGRKGKYNTFTVIAIGVIMALFAGLRSINIGTDTRSYVEAFRNIVPMGTNGWEQFIPEKEYFYFFLTSAVRALTDNYTVLLMIIAIFYMLSVCVFIRRYSAYPTMSFLMFMSMAYYSFSMAGLRQTIAMGFMLFAVDAVIKKKWIRAILLILLASLFHISALSGFLFILLYLLPLNVFYVAGCIFLTAFFYFFGPSLLKPVLDFIWGDSRNYEIGEFGGTSTLILLVLMAIAIALVMPTIFKKKKALAAMDEADSRALTINGYFYRLLLISIPFQVLAIHQANAFRIAMIFHITAIALLPNAIKAQKFYNSRAIMAIVVMALLLFQLFVYTYGAADINPFTFFWQVRT